MAADTIWQFEPLDWGLPMGLGTPPFAAHRFTSAPETAKATRCFARHTLESWEFTNKADNAITVANELVTNAIQHALTRHGDQSAWLALTALRHSVVCAVNDPSPRPPRPSAPGRLKGRGRGLRIVTALSDEWGYRTLGNGTGKTVWARISL